MKHCPTCDTNKQLSEYYPHKTRGYAHECKDCNRERSKRYSSNNKEKIAAYNKRWREKNATPDYNRNRSLKSRYGITKEDYDKMHKSQGGICAICGGVNPDGKRLSVDHNHTTGKVRKLLCLTCNWQVGFIETTQVT